MAGLLALLGMGVTLGTLTFAYYGLAPVFFWVLFVPMLLYPITRNGVLVGLVTLVPVLGMLLGRTLEMLVPEDNGTEGMDGCMLSISFSMASGWSGHHLFSFGEGRLQIVAELIGQPEFVIWQVVTGLCVLGSFASAAYAIVKWK